MQTKAYLMVGTISAFLGTLKLVSDNQSKISDFRLEWNESLRLAVSRFNASAHTILGRISIEKPENRDNENLKSELRPNWYDLRESYNLISLHFNNKQKNNEKKELSGGQRKLDDIHEANLWEQILATQKFLEQETYSDIYKNKDEIKEKIEAINQKTSIILKENWEKVKRGVTAQDPP